MKMIKLPLNLALSALAVFAALGLAPAANAQITWGTAQNITGDTDVLTTGTLVFAYDWQGPEGSTTVNGVAFTGETNAASPTDLTLPPMVYFPNACMINAAPYNELSAAYSNILSGELYNVGTAPLTFTIGGLTSGNFYSVQFWVNVPNAGDASLEVTLGNVSGGNSVILNSSYPGASLGAGGGYPGQYSIGTFMASGTTQTFTLSSSAAQGFGIGIPSINAIQVRTLPVVNAPISWGPAMPITGNADVSTSGTLIYAYAAGNTASPTVNGVSFADWSGAGNAVTGGGSPVTFNSSGFGSTAAPFTSLSSSYQSLLAAGATNSTGTLTVNLTNLTSGTQYEVQVWANDASAGNASSETVDGQSTLFYSAGALAGQPGSYALGTFVANGPAQIVTLNPVVTTTNAQINALQVRSVPTGAPLVLAISVSPTNNASAVALSAVTSGSGLTYQWQSSPGNDGTFANISGATASTLTVINSGVAATTGYRLALSNSVGVSTSMVAVVTLTAPPAQGNIAWGPAMAASGDADVFSDGVGLVAYEANTSASLIINGVTFTQFLPLVDGGVSGVTNANDQVTMTASGDHIYCYNYNNGLGFGWTTAPFANLSVNYQDLLAGGNADSNGTPCTFVFSGLTPGAIYGVQVWENDSSGNGAGRNETLSDGFGNSVILGYNTSGLIGGVGQYVIGEGVATSASNLSFTASGEPGVYNQINAFQLRCLSGNFMPYVTAVVMSPTNEVFASIPITITEAALGPVGVTTNYQWQWNFGGGAFSNVTGASATSSTLSLNTTGLAAGTYNFQVVVSNVYGSKVVSTLYGTNGATAPISLTILPPSPPALSSVTPDSLKVIAGAGSAVFTAVAIGSLPLYYEWVSDNGAGNGVFTNVVSGYNTNNPGTLTVSPSTLLLNTIYSYEVIVTNTYGAVTSAPVMLEVFPVPQPPSQGFSWGPVASVAQVNSDVSTNGRGVVAFCGAASSVTLNGVTFATFAPSDVTLSNGSGASTQLGITNTTGGVTTSLTIGPDSLLAWSTGWGSSLAPFASLPADYQRLLAGANYDGYYSGDAWTLKFSGLTTGSIYELQFWGNDSTAAGVGAGGRNDTLSALSGSGWESPPVCFNTGQAAGGVGTYVIGTAEADTNGDITINVQGNGNGDFDVPPYTQVNAFQLRQLSAESGAPSVNPPQPASVVEYVGQNGSVVFSSAAGGAATLSYQWVSNNGAGNFSAIAGATSNSLTVNPTGFAAGAYQYCLVVTNTSGVATSAVSSLTVAPMPTPPANGITWGPAADILGDTDVRTDGIGIVAFCAGPGGATVNGVLFSTYAPPDASLIPGAGGFTQSAYTEIANTTDGVTTTVTLGSGGVLYWDDGFGADILPFSSLSANYQNLLAGANGELGGVIPWTLAFSGLTPNQVYEIQFWGDDSRVYGYNRYDALSDSYGNPAVTINLDTSGDLGGVGQFAVGASRADSSGTITAYVLATNSTQINAFQLRELPSAGPPLVTPPQPASVVEYVGQNGTIAFTSSAAGVGTLSYQWLNNNGSGTFSAIPGATTHSLTVNTAGFAVGTYQYELAVSNTSGATTSAVASVTVAALPTPPSQGIAWGPAANDLGDSDVRTEGAGVVACCAAPGGVTLNGVSFSTFAPADADLLPGGFDQSIYTAITNSSGNVVANIPAGTADVMDWYDAFGEPGYLPFSSLSANYQNLLAGGDGDYYAYPWTLQFSGLKAGDTYEIQFWVNESGSEGVGRTDLLTDTFGNPPAVVSFNANGITGGVGQFVIGETTSSGTIVFDLAGNATTQINAFQLRDLSIVTPVAMSIAQSGTNIVISWTGSNWTLEHAPALTGPWTTNGSSISPCTIALTNAQQFYRLMAP
jgi:hypothetical protein